MDRTEFQWFRTLLDIDDELDNLKSKKKIYDIELKRWGTGGDLEKDGAYITALRRQTEIERILITLKGKEKELKKQRKEIVGIVEEFKGLEHDILRLKYIKGYKLTQVAEELDYSYQHIKNKHSEVMREVREHLNTVL